MTTVPPQAQTPARPSEKPALARIDCALRCALGWLAVRPAPRSLALLAMVPLLFLAGWFTIPPIDRDEARYAQATKQMLESGDFFDIRFQDDPRHKKPIGIYWLQAAAVAPLGTDARDAIWAYRIPSLIGVAVVLLLIPWCARPLVGPEAALLAAVLVAATIILGVEARLAKTDAALLATIVAMQGALARVWLDPATPGWRWPALFWTALGMGILIKGPVGLERDSGRTD